MIPEVRKTFNASYKEENFNAFTKELSAKYGMPGFRVAETPVFVPKYFLEEMLHTCETVVDAILQPDFKEKTERAIPVGLKVPNEYKTPECIAFDFGVCRSANGRLEPQLIEMQAFPTLFAYQIVAEAIYAKHFELPKNFDSHLKDLDDASYLKLLRETILGNHDSKHVVLLEVFPHQQKTKIDFYFTKDLTGIRPTCVTELIKKGNHLYYKDDEGIEVEIKRIYNRVIFDELLQQEKAVQEKAKILFEDNNVEWAPHPNWFYRVSKFTLPLITHPNIPETHYLNEVKEIPANLNNYVLKPLFSFAGQGVIIDVTANDIKNVTDPENWILQKKVEYAAVVNTPDEPAKAEIRLFYFWKDGAPRPIPANDLARLSKGKMIGVRYNKNKIWTGGSFCMFEK